ncbi:hypothetical protein SAMN02745216_01559 [Desulfatibacillum alkenivorans DSM 16219]|jgi:hypothetical protein|uniref:Reverse transcriptase (RNA-dependent DNA polymerase) n=1 Tax=Desulfatibacillum alkenivorans DSM 16219 TaxID=1121393 RepID=A0A1M6IXR4_9BACT|nr:hypothetical protein [Desulfatibacillum alkenivorans]SHJ39211.1 hypothetical protein SAMN02745216_01559 [Desulfatibacillum alkenivorans DSM 16219]
MGGEIPALHEEYKPYGLIGNAAAPPLGIPAVKDRIVQTALKMVIEPIFEQEFLYASYGFRLGLGGRTPSGKWTD